MLYYGINIQSLFWCLVSKVLLNQMEAEWVDGNLMNADWRISLVIELMVALKLAHFLYFWHNQRWICAHILYQDIYILGNGCLYLFVYSPFLQSNSGHCITMEHLLRIHLYHNSCEKVYLWFGLLINLCERLRCFCNHPC